MSTATGNGRNWVIPAISGVVVAGGWTAVAAGAADGVTGPSRFAVFGIGAVLLCVITWRVHAWVVRRHRGASSGSIVGRSTWEGAVTGALMATVAYSFAVVGDGTAVTNFMLAIVMIPWVILGALVFALLALPVVATTRGYGQSQRASDQD